MQTTSQTPKHKPSLNTKTRFLTEQEKEELRKELREAAKKYLNQK